MGIFNFLETKQSKVPKNITGSSFSITPGNASWSTTNYVNLAKSGYIENPIVFQCINKLADTVATVPLKLMARETEIKKHEFLDLINNPNQTQSKSEFIRAVISYFLLSGNSYIERVVLNNKPKELFTLRPDKMSIKIHNGKLSYYEYKQPNGGKIKWEIEPITLDSDIWHIKNFNPLDEIYGASRVAAGAKVIQQYNKTLDWLQSLLDNAAVPSGILNVKKKLSESQYKQLKEEIENSFSGAKNSGKPMLTEGDTTWQSLGINPERMNVLATRNATAREIAIVIGVPPQLLGLVGENTYSNYKTARRAFYIESVLPLVSLLVDDLNSFICKKYYPEVSLTVDLDKLKENLNLFDDVERE